MDTKPITVIWFYVKFLELYIHNFVEGEIKYVIPSKMFL